MFTLYLQSIKCVKAFPEKKCTYFNLKILHFLKMLLMNYFTVITLKISYHRTP